MSATDIQQQNQASKDAVVQFLEVFSSSSVEGIMDMLTDDATWWVAGTIPGISGEKSKEEFREMVSGIAANCKGPIKLTPHHWTVDGERVAVETESYAELNNGRVYNNQYHFLMTVRDGKISGVKEYLDTSHTYDVFVAE